MTRKIEPDPDSWIRVLNEMLQADEYDFAAEYLEDVREQVAEKRTITKKQTNAILNIRRSAQ